MFYCPSFLLNAAVVSLSGFPCHTDIICEKVDAMEVIEVDSFMERPPLSSIREKIVSGSVAAK